MPRLEQHLLAFLDILGFSQMVSQDCEAPAGEEEHLVELFAAHTEIQTALAKYPGYVATQFSDSVVVARPLDLQDFGNFVQRVCDYQRALLKRGLLCRGAIVFGKHYASGSFMFSGALVQAYGLESKEARYPRVIIAPDLIELVPAATLRSSPILREHDGYHFADYLGMDNDLTAREDVERIVKRAPKAPGSAVAEKMRWLANYCDHRLGTQLARPWFAEVVGAEDADPGQGAPQGRAPELVAALGQQKRTRDEERKTKRSPRISMKSSS